MVLYILSPSLLDNAPVIQKRIYNITFASFCLITSVTAADDGSEIICSKFQFFMSIIIGIMESSINDVIHLGAIHILRYAPKGGEGVS